MKLAVTGGTGFVGSRLLDLASEAGHEVRALTRRAMRPRVNVQWVEGSLDPARGLAELVRGSKAVIHIAGVLTGRTAADFEGCNVHGTAAMIKAAEQAGVRRFVHVSSLAAREPQLSLYGASKARSEEIVAASGLDWVIVRPPAVYGPRDRETLELFRMAKARLMLLPPRGRLSVLHVDDLARLLLALSESAAPKELIVEPDDGRPGGWSHEEFAGALAQAVGRPALKLHVPAPLLRLAARTDQLVRGRRAKLTLDRASYFSHPDWVADRSRAVPQDLWTPMVRTDHGLAETAQWYRSNGWL